MKTYAAAALGVGVVIVVGIGAKFAVKGNGEGVSEVDIKLSLDRGGVCQPSQPLMLGGTYDDGVTWRVTNVDCPAQYIEMGNFRPYKNGVPGNQDKKVIKPDPAVGGPILTTATTPFLLTSQIKKWQWFTYQKFKYDISLGTTSTNPVVRLDPDIDIWP